MMTLWRHPLSTLALITATLLGAQMSGSPMMRAFALTWTVISLVCSTYTTRRALCPPTATAAAPWDAVLAPWTRRLRWWYLAGATVAASGTLITLIGRAVWSSLLALLSNTTIPTAALTTLTILTAFAMAAGWTREAVNHDRRTWRDSLRRHDGTLTQRGHAVRARVQDELFALRHAAHRAVVEIPADMAATIAFLHESLLPSSPAAAEDRATTQWALDTLRHPANGTVCLSREACDSLLAVLQPRPDEPDIAAMGAMAAGRGIAAW